MSLRGDYNNACVTLPQESSIDLKTLSLANFESEDPDFALVRTNILKWIFSNFIVKISR